MTGASVTPIGKYVFGSLIAPSTSPFPGEPPYWSVGLVLGELESEPLFNLLESILAEQRKNNEAYPKENTQLLLPYGPSMKKDATGIKKPVEGEYVWKFKRKTVVKKKDLTEERQTPPIIYDSNGAIVNGTVNNIGWGSTGKVIFRSAPFAKGRNIGVSFQLNGFQIASLQDMQTDEVELTPIEGGFVADDAPAAPMEPVTQAVDDLEEF